MFFARFFYHEANDLQSFHPINLNLQIFRFPLRARDLFAKIVTTFEQNLQNNLLIPFYIYLWIYDLKNWWTIAHVSIYLFNLKMEFRKVKNIHLEDWAHPMTCTKWVVNHHSFSQLFSRASLLGVPFVGWKHWAKALMFCLGWKISMA